RASSSTAAASCRASALTAATSTSSRSSRRSGSGRRGSSTTAAATPSRARAAPAPGPAAGGYPPNTRGSPTRGVGVRRPHNASNPAVSAAKERESFLAGQALVRLIAKNICPRDVITRKSLENAYTLVLALGGSTNAVLHLMAIAREAGVEWTLADFDRLGGKGPPPADLKPGRPHALDDLHP